MIKYTTIKYGGCCGQPEREFQVPDNITPHELSLLIPGLSLEDATELLARRIEPDPSCDFFSSQLIQRQVRKECLPPAQGTLVTISIPAGRFTSELSQLDADQQAEAEFQRIAQSTANQLGTCQTPTCVNCSSFRVTRSLPCGEFRRSTQCNQGQCVDTSQEYFVCTGDCDGERCRQSCTVCSSICPTGSCPPGSNCVNGSCVINCEGADCSSDCPQGRCQDPCTECRNGRCVSKTCPAGQICVNGTCVDRPCNPECGDRIITPGPNDCIQRSIVQTCQSGRCVDTTEERTVNIREGLTCGTNRTCQNGQCTELPCVNQGGSCASGGVCCSGTFCFQGTCVNACPQGFIQQGTTCVVDNGPNVKVQQTTVIVPGQSSYFVGGITGVAGQSNLTFVNHINSAIAGTFKGQSFITRMLILGTESSPPPSFNPSTQVYIRLTNTSPQGIDAGLNQYINSEYNPIFGSDYNVTILAPGQSTWVTPGLNISGFSFVPRSASSSPIFSGTLFSTEGIPTVTVTVSMRIGGNFYNTPGYTPQPSVFTGFGFSSNWTSFQLQSNDGNFTLEGRIVGANLEVRNASRTRIFGNQDFTFRRLIGTFQVGTTTTRTLQ